MSDFLERKNDVAGEMLARLPSVFRDKPRIEAFIRALANQFQRQEQDLWDFMSRTIDDAEDADLVNLGKIVGEPRQGWEDAEYRQYIRARVKTNRSDGRLETLIAIMVFLLGTANTVKVREYYPSAIVFEGTEHVTINAEYIKRGFLQKAVSASVNIDFVAHPQARAATFILDDSTSPFVVGVTQGFGDSVAGVVGGLLSSRYG